MKLDGSHESTPRISAGEMTTGIGGSSGPCSLRMQAIDR
jgi:hypothetical protein